MIRLRGYDPSSNTQATGRTTPSPNPWRPSNSAPRQTSTTATIRTTAASHERKRPAELGPTEQAHPNKTRARGPYRTISARMTPRSASEGEIALCGALRTLDRTSRIRRR